MCFNCFKSIFIPYHRVRQQNFHPLYYIGRYVQEGMKVLLSHPVYNLTFCGKFSNNSPVCFVYITPHFVVFNFLQSASKYSIRLSTIRLFDYSISLLVFCQSIVLAGSLLKSDSGERRKFCIKCHGAGITQSKICSWPALQITSSERAHTTQDNRLELREPALTVAQIKNGI